MNYTSARGLDRQDLQSPYCVAEYTGLPLQHQPAQTSPAARSKSPYKRLILSGTPKHRKTSQPSPQKGAGTGLRCFVWGPTRGQPPRYAFLMESLRISPSPVPLRVIRPDSRT